MNEKTLGYFNAAFMGVTLFITMFLIYKYKGVNGFYFGESFIIINTIKDIVMYKLGFTFRGIGIKPMIITNLILLFLLIIFHISVMY